ncbi:S8 family serine peptidase, partial [Cellulomonas soli]
CSASALAADDPSDGGLWYYTQTGLADIQQHTTGEGITIAIIDSAINPDVPDLQGTNLTVHEPAYCVDPANQTPLPATATDDSAFHATGMAALIVGTGVGAGGVSGVRGVAPASSVLTYFAVSLECGAPGSTGRALRQAVDDGADIVNMSFTSEGAFNSLDAEDVIYAVSRGVILVASSPHDGGASLSAYPIGYNGVVGVDSYGPGGSLSDSVVAADFVDVIAPGDDMLAPDSVSDWTSYALTDGSSSATAFTSAALALAWSAHPDATSNQILQTLAHTTGTDGLINLNTLVADDPTSYPDTNPYITTDAIPSPQDIANATTQTTPTTSTTDNPGTDDPATPTSNTTGLPGWVLPAAITATLLAAAGITTIVLLTRRGTTNPTTPPGGHHG